MWKKIIIILNYGESHFEEFEGEQYFSKRNFIEIILDELATT